MKLDLEQINTAYRTSLVTFAAACALVIVNYSTEVFNLNCICRTNLCALHTTDTACLTLFSCNSALFVVFAKHSCFFHIEREKVNKVSGTGFNAHLTSLTLVGVDSCHTVADAREKLGERVWSEVQSGRIKKPGGVSMFYLNK